MLWIAFLVLFTLAIVLAQAKSTSDARPRGRYARQVAWSPFPARRALRIPRPSPGIAQPALARAGSAPRPANRG